MGCNTTALSTAYHQIVNAIIAGSGMQHSVVPLDPDNMPLSDFGERFAVDVQSQNTRGLRDRDVIELSHRVTVTTLHKIDMHDDHTASVMGAMDDEQRIIVAVMNRQVLPYHRATYDTTARRIMGGGESLKTEIRFSIVSTIEVTYEPS